ncbi:hypothetical protein [Pseudarthrobacter phenanthrenivorans]|uniref:Uncharacterized protein n=1 Tax=Pseudarthrobacter phenanthrenivorans TaxID=361575 RepID=A0A0B4DPQ1_PSEPS|nr:hypothetical protein [Pseudarthrobacter phenanthrenivorans]KIC68681.1 hypothetical protein RM50_04235 [Pseudarthrobacter phenanthrenivorans]
MSAVTAAKATPSFAAVDDLGWNRLHDLAFESKNRRLLGHVVLAENADSRVVAEVVSRAISNGWDDVLESAVTSRHTILRDHAAILRCGKTFTEEVYQGILRATDSPAILAMLRDAPYDSVKEGVVAKRIGIVKDTIKAAGDNPDAYPFNDGDEHEVISQAVTIALALDRHDLLAGLVATGCTGELTADRIAMNNITLPQPA